ncbi:uncharacterized protein LOC124934422 [Impatiens glandulifera]|uniref:uncharacterized protein LOC124934422 n=1 Tax=Impatiens glandulifera TaxID=253017 RepID=UPI001FB0A1AB|nr:uncharacterized protein LOC124934422 [Impatiens glandulifera]
MARIIGMFVLISSALLISSWIPVSICAKKPVGVARKEDVPFIKCQVCETLSRQIHQQVEAKKDQISPKKVSEYEIIELVENVCNLKKMEADWILKIDIVEQGDKLELIEQDSEGQCNSKCKTIERACHEVLGYYDTDVAEYVYKSKPSLDSLVKFLCKDLSKACSSPPPPLPKDRAQGEPFVPKSSKEAEMERMLKSMEGMPGAPNMKMYSREDLMNGNYGNEDAADEDEDDDDEADFPSKLGKAMKGGKEESKKIDWKQTMKKKMVDTREVLRKHANKISYRIQKWWKGKTKSRPTKKSSKAEL